MQPRDAVPAFISAFLDDSCIFLAGAKADIGRGRLVALNAFKFLGWALSQPKMELEGALDPIIVVLGHGFDCSKQERFVTVHKISRVREGIRKLFKAAKVCRLELASLLGLAQSVRANIVRRWRLSPAYNCLHAPGDATYTKLPARARSCLQRVSDSLEERRSIWTLPPRWEIPSLPLVPNVPNVDAAEQAGVAGVMMTDTSVQFFARPWSRTLQRQRIGSGPSKR
jgi:hypothetical protein